jgi:hypothetical protein
MVPKKLKPIGLNTNDNRYRFFYKGYSNLLLSHLLWEAGGWRQWGQRPPVTRPPYTFPSLHQANRKTDTVENFENNLLWL